MDKHHIFENFKMYFPSLAAKSKICMDGCVEEIMITLDNGDVIIYDNISKSITNIDDTSWEKEFARRLNRRVSLGGITQQLISDKTGISRQTVNQYLNGTTVPSLTNIRSIANVLNCSVSDLVDF